MALFYFSFVVYEKISCNVMSLHHIHRCLIRCLCSLQWLLWLSAQFYLFMTFLKQLICCIIFEVHNKQDKLGIIKYHLVYFQMWMLSSQTMFFGNVTPCGLIVSTEKIARSSSSVLLISNEGLPSRNLSGARELLQKWKASVVVPIL